MYECFHACMYAHVYVCTCEFPDDNKQEILEPKIFNIFFSVPLKKLFLLQFSMNIFKKHFYEHFQKHFLDNPVFRLVAILKSINNIFEKTTSKKSIFKVGDSESISKIL